MITKDTINDLAAEFDRLFPSQVDSESGHCGHDSAYYASNGRSNDGFETVGWYGAGGTGNPVLDVQTDDVPRACGVLRTLAQVDDLDEVVRWLKNAGVSCEVRA